MIAVRRYCIILTILSIISWDTLFHVCFETTLTSTLFWTFRIVDSSLRHVLLDFGRYVRLVTYIILHEKQIVPICLHDADSILASCRASVL